MGWLKQLQVIAICIFTVFVLFEIYYAYVSRNNPKTTLINELSKPTALQMGPKGSAIKPKLLDMKLDFPSAAEAEKSYYETIAKITVNCSLHKRIGRPTDGGYDVCLAGNYNLRSPCLTYSFGINYIWEYDDMLATTYKCTVRTFDPSMTKEPNQLQRPSKVWFYKIGLSKDDTTWSNGWNMMKMSSILKKFNEENTVIDVLKIDIEYSEWDSFELMIKEGLLSKVKQIMFEAHTEEVVPGRTTTKESFIRYLRVWNNLYELGFRQWKNRWVSYCNIISKYTNTQITFCYEHFLININYM